MASPDDCPIAAGAVAGAVVTGIASLPGKIAEIAGSIATASTDLAGRDRHGDDGPRRAGR